jgi:hypothetical protein
MGLKNLQHQGQHKNLTDRNFFILKDIDEISTLSYSKCQVLRKGYVDLFARMTFLLE